MHCGYCGRSLTIGQGTCPSCGRLVGSRDPEGGLAPFKLFSLVGFNAFLLGYLLPFIEGNCSTGRATPFSGLALTGTLWGHGASVCLGTAGFLSLGAGFSAAFAFLGLAAAVLVPEALAPLAAGLCSALTLAGLAVFGVGIGFSAAPKGAWSLSPGFFVAGGIAAGLLGLSVKQAKLIGKRKRAGADVGADAGEAGVAPKARVLWLLAGLAAVALLVALALWNGLSRYGAPASAGSTTMSPMTVSAAVTNGPAPALAGTTAAAFTTVPTAVPSPVPIAAPRVKARPARRHSASAKSKEGRSSAKARKAAEWDAMGGSLAQKGKLDDAILAYKKALDNVPGDPTACKGLVDAYMATGDLVEALKYKKLLQQ